MGSPPDGELPVHAMHCVVHHQVACLRLQNHISRQSRNWLRERVSQPWRNGGALDSLLDVGLACTAVDPYNRLDLATARRRLADVLNSCAREARECM